ncbi:MAG: hypothetical protein H6840_10465 [Planctomycetes bacterium]|nr:hypothetical protein [Planctomycetota bacterium]
MRLTLLACLAFAALLAACASERLPAPRAAQHEPAPEPVNELAQRAYDVLRDDCWGCHGQPGRKAYGETTPLDWILDYDKLIETKTVIPGHPGKSRLIYITAVLGKMPRAFDEQGAPSIEVELSEADQQTLIDWIKEGAPRWK